MTRLAFSLATMLVVTGAARAVAADLPRPLPGHPGNIFVEGEDVAISGLAPIQLHGWKLVDYDGKTVRESNYGAEAIAFGKLPVGYYELHSGTTRVPIGVLAPLKAATPKTSPISIDVAMAWFYKSEAQQRAVIRLCQLAGVNWVRDRLSWPTMEPTRGTFAGHNIYDDTAKLQSEAGLQVLQVNHASPPWANPDGRRQPLDLRDAYRFYKEMASRWKGQVLAIEPWNEADIDVFGGHTGAEMAAFQKAAYLGLKAGNPNVIACQNVFAIARQATLDDFAANEAAAYFDTYNLHHYVPFDKYPAYYAAHRAVSGGKPMWVTECNVTVNWADEKTHEPSDEALRWQANRVAKVYAMSLHEGSVNTFYFILGHYVERTLQYGVIHEDLTPRPAYVAVAAAGRLLADAKPLGRWKHPDPGVYGYLFRAKTDGKEKLVFVAWTRGKSEVKTKLEAPVEELIDHLGRERQGTWDGELTLTAAPVYAILPAGIKPPIDLDPPPVAAPLNHDKPVPVVLQALLPPETIDLQQSAYVLPPDREHVVQIAGYNFGGEAASGDISVAAPKGVHWQMDQSMEVLPSGRQLVQLKLLRREPSPGLKTIELKWRGAKLSFRVVDSKTAPQEK